MDTYRPGGQLPDYSASSQSAAVVVESVPPVKNLLTVVRSEKTLRPIPTAWIMPPPPPPNPPSSPPRPPRLPRLQPINIVLLVTDSINRTIRNRLAMCLPPITSTQGVVHTTIMPDHTAKPGLFNIPIAPVAAKSAGASRLAAHTNLRSLLKRQCLVPPEEDRSVSRSD